MEKEVIIKTKTKNVIKILGIRRAVKILCPYFKNLVYNVDERVSVIEYVVIEFDYSQLFMTRF